MNVSRLAVCEDHERRIITSLGTSVLLAQNWLKIIPKFSICAVLFVFPVNFEVVSSWPDDETAPLLGPSSPSEDSLGRVSLGAGAGAGGRTLLQVFGADAQEEQEDTEAAEHPESDQVSGVQFSWRGSQSVSKCNKVACAMLVEVD